MAFDEPRPPASAVVSPKVVAAAVTDIALVVVVGGISAITPELFNFLGDWKAVAFAGVVALGGALAGYIKNDPRRV